MAVAVDKETLDVMSQTFSDVCDGESHFFSGYQDPGVKGEWRDVNTGDLITWSNWAKGEPSGGETEQCSKILSGEMYDETCSRKTCPICRVRTRTKGRLIYSTSMDSIFV